MIDVGTGAGFPSLPLKIVYPQIKLTMLDSLNKRIIFLNEVISQLGLKDVEAIHGRAEEYAAPGKYREKFDIGVSRAVANLSTLSEYCLPYIKEGGIFVAYKSEELLKNKSDDNGLSEKDNAANAIKVLGGKIENIVEYDLCDEGLYRCLCVIKKERPTPKKYPRKAGLPSKEPIK
jgi:16S rRNA (guanine527-N7)-methyltransferase